MLVEVGQEVKVGDAVVVLEAMKMENQLQAEKAGSVKSINVTPGDKVGSGDVLVVIALPTTRAARTSSRSANAGCKKSHASATSA